MTPANHHEQHQRRSQRGTTVAELVVSATLLIAAMTAMAPLAVQTNQLWQDSRRHHLVIDELSSQLDRLIHLDPASRDQALSNMEPTEHLRSILPSAEMTARVVEDESGRRIIVALDWTRLGNPQPVSLVGWLDPIPNIEPEVPILRGDDAPTPDTEESSP